MNCKTTNNPDGKTYIIHDVVIADMKETLSGIWPYNRFLNCTEKSVDLTIAKEGMCFVNVNYIGRPHITDQMGVICKVVIKAGRVYADIKMHFHHTGLGIAESSDIIVENLDYDVITKTRHMISEWMLMGLTIGVRI